MALKKAREQLSEWTDDLDLEDVLFGLLLAVLIVVGIFAGPATCSLRVDSHDNPSTTTTTIR